MSASGAGAASSRITILDGGTGRELQRLGAPFRQPEWSALALIEAPEFVTAVHRSFAEAGADVVTTNAYALVPFHIGTDRFESEGADLARFAAQLARAVGDDYGITVAGDLPPVLGSYRPDLFEQEIAEAILSVLIDAQAPFVDVWLSETLSSIAEADLVGSLLRRRNDARPWWVSFTLADHLVDTSLGGTSSLRSGETITDAAIAVRELGATMMSFNCSPPEVMAPAVREARAVLDDTFPIGVYANAFEDDQTTETPANDALHGVRDDLGPQRYADWAERWVEAGATMIGGCCGIGSEHIEVLASRLGTKRRQLTHDEQHDR